MKSLFGISSMFIGILNVYEWMFKPLVIFLLMS